MLLGVNAANHDASVCLVHDQQVIFAAHAERYSRVKNDTQLNTELVQDLLNYGTPTAVCWYEQPWKRLVRQIMYREPVSYYSIRKLLQPYGLDHLPVHTVPHHRAHAAHGFCDSGYDQAVVLVVDAIGEWMTTSIWLANGKNLKCKWKQNYPHSMGLFYSAITQHLGYKPNEEEFIVMGMAAYGHPLHVEHMRELLFEHYDPPNYKTVYMHRGIRGLLPEWWLPENVAASAQAIWENYIMRSVCWITKTYPGLPLVITGGGALNCVANNRVRDLVGNLHVPANPGDAGLALGAVAAVTKVQPSHAYLGHNIQRQVDIDLVVQSLLAGNIVGIANGRAEWGPRALGNRSILADPRGVHMRDKVNEIKHREKFRPFAPAVLAEHAASIFDIDHNDTSAMQYAVKCLQPDLYPAVCHVDASARVQVVAADNPSVLRKILEAWYWHTGCAVLLNTSMNVRGEPLVNTAADAQRFSQVTGVEVF
jgi:carbamoyltransferase